MVRVRVSVIVDLMVAVMFRVAQDEADLVIVVQVVVLAVTVGVEQGNVVVTFVVSVQRPLSVTVLVVYVEMLTSQV